MRWMRFTITALAMALSLAGAAASWAQEATPEAFLKSLYALYEGNDPQGVLLETDEEIRHYFAPALAALIIKDQVDAAQRDDVPALDGDPFVDAQDWQIEEIRIAVEHKGADQAQGTVTFKNLGNPVTVRLDLVRLADGWKISEIYWEHGRLSAIFGGS